MGINSATLSKAARGAAGISIVGGRARPALEVPLVGWCWWLLEMEPPTTTHHDKDIGWRTSKRTGRRAPTIVNNPRLNAVWEIYCRHLPERPALIPLAQPVVLHATFWFPCRPSQDEPADWHVEKPDLDNQVKVLKDVLALRGYLQHDQQVAKEVLAKLRSKTPWIFVYARTLGRYANDQGEVHVPLAQLSDHTQGVVHPIPQATAAELEIFEKCQNGTRRAAEIGTPGGERRPDSPRPRIGAAAGRFVGSAGRSGAPPMVTGVQTPAPQTGRKRKRS